MGISLDEVILDANTSNIAISDGTNTLAVNGDGSLDVAFAAGAQIEITDGSDTLAINGDGSLNAVVTATDLDIRNLVFATDKVDVSGSSVTASATDFDIRDLTFATDKVDASGSDVSVKSDTTLKNSQDDVTTTAAEVLATPLTGRRSVTIQNEGSQPVYIGSSAAVTSSNGIKLGKNSSATFAWDASMDIFMIADSGTQDVRFLESAQ